VFEAYAPNGWERYADAGFGVRRFGHSLPCETVYKYFGFDAEVMTRKVLGYLKTRDEDEFVKGEFVDL